MNGQVINLISLQYFSYSYILNENKFTNNKLSA